MTDTKEDYKHLRSITAGDLPRGLFLAVGHDGADMFLEIGNDLHELGGCIWKDVEDRVWLLRDLGYSHWIALPEDFKFWGEA